MICATCGGTGWVYGVKWVKRPGIEPRVKRSSAHGGECEPREAAGASAVTAKGIRNCSANSAC